MRRFVSKRHLAALAATTSLFFVTESGVWPGAGLAQTPAQSSSQRYQFDLPAKPVRQAVNDIARIAGLSVVVTESPAASATGQAVKGEMTVSDALTQLLGKTGLTHSFVNGDTILVSSPTGTDADGATRLQPVTVLGKTGPATDGLDTYATSRVTIGKSERRLREIPQSISVFTSQRLEDQDLNLVNDIIGATTGATILKSDDFNERSEIYMRGFPLNSLQVDGSSISGNNDVTIFDSAIYDRVEILRGPAGILQGAREPGGTVNLVRKHAQDEFAGKAEAQIGSWNRHRLEADVGGPLVESGALRGRVVGAWDKGDSFIDLVHYDRKLAYGILDLDVAEQTTLTFGGTWQEGEGRTSRGLPAYADGTLLDVPRSTYVGTGWEHSETRSADVFASLEHRFEGGGDWNLHTSYLDRYRDGKLAYADAPVDPVTGFTELLPEHRIDREKNFNIDSWVNLPVEIGGLTQRFLFGADYHSTNEERDEAEGDSIPQNVFNPDHNLPEPDLTLNSFTGAKTRQYGLYGQAQIKPVARATLLLGGRFSWWRTRSFDRGTGNEDSRASVNGEFTPYLGAVFEVTDNVSVYASSASIFVPQDELTVDNEVLSPREGQQYEVGTQAEFMQGRLNARLSAFHIEETNRAVSDPDNEDYYLAAGKVRGRGIEAEVTGEVLPLWDVSAGYTYLTSKFIDDPDNSGVYAPYAPKHSFRLWSKYRIEEGPAAGLSFGGGIQAFASSHLMDGDVRFRTPGYATVDLQVGYRINEHARATLTATNIFDRTYYQSVGNSERQNYYGEPRAVMFKLASNF